MSHTGGRHGGAGRPFVIARARWAMPTLHMQFDRRAGTARRGSGKHLENIMARNRQFGSLSLDPEDCHAEVLRSIWPARANRPDTLKSVGRVYSPTIRHWWWASTPTLHEVARSSGN